MILSLKKIFWLLPKAILVIFLLMAVWKFLFHRMEQWVNPYSIWEEPAKYVSHEVGFSLPEGKVTTIHNDIGGFFGEGECYIRIEFAPEQFEELESEIKNQKGWKRCPPVSKEIKSFIYGTKEYHTIFQTLFCEHCESSVSIVPTVDSGYCFVHNRHADCQDPYDEKELYQGIFEYDSDHNEVIVFLDEEEMSLYYTEFVT